MADSSRRAFIPALNAIDLRAAEALETFNEAETTSVRGKVGKDSGLPFSFKTFRRKKLVPDRLDPLASGSPRSRRHFHPQRHVSIPSTVSSSHALAPHSPRIAKGSTSQEAQDDELLALQRLDAHLASKDIVQDWIRAYDLERGNFASFAVFTEVKLDEVQEVYVAQAGRPNAVEAAACCATLLKMPGIVGCYRTLLEKIAAGIQGAIYLPERAPSATSSSSDSMTALVTKFYAQIPYFERVQELEKTLLASRSILDPNVLRSLSMDDVSRLFQHVPIAHVQAGLVKVYAGNVDLLDQLISVLQEQQRRLLPRRETCRELEDPDYPLHVPLATSAQICRAIAHNAARFSSSGRELILCAIVDWLDMDSFHNVFEHFDRHGKACFLHYLSVNEGLEELEQVVGALPNAGESLFRVYVATCLGQADELVEDSTRRCSPKDVFFGKLLSSEMEFFFVSDLATYLTEAQWQLLSNEFEKNESVRKTRRQERGKTKRVKGEEDDEDEDQREQLSLASASIDRFQLNIMRYIRRHNLTSAQLLQLIGNMFLSTLEEHECSQLLDNCWARFPLANRWSKALAIVQDLNGGSTQSTLGLRPVVEASVDDHVEQAAAIRLKMLKEVFTMLTQEERAVWMDENNAEYPTEKYQRTIQDLKDAATEVKELPDVSDPAVHLARMEEDVKMRWLDALIQCLANGTESAAKFAALKQALVSCTKETKALPTALAPEDSQSSLSLTEQMFEQLSADDQAAFLGKFALLQDDNVLVDVVDLVASQGSILPASSDGLLPVSSSTHELEHVTLQVDPSADIPTAMTTLFTQRSEAQGLEALEKTGKERKEEAPVARHLERKPTIDRQALLRQEQRNVKSVDVGCQTTFDTEQEAVDSLSTLRSLDKTQGTSRMLVRLPKTTPLTLSALLGKTNAGTGGKSKKDKYQKINNAAVPRAIAGLITSWRMNTEQLVQFAKKSLGNILKIIADAYSELLAATRRKSQHVRLAYASPRRPGQVLTLSQIVYQSFLHSYGLPSIADMHLLAFSCALETYRTQHLRVEHFARFCFEEVPKAQLTHYLEFLEGIVCEDLTETTMASHGTSPMPMPASTPGNALHSGATSRSLLPSTSTSLKQSRLGLRVSVPDKENWTISIDRAQDIVHLCFRTMRKTAVSAFCEKLMAIGVQGTSTAVLPFVETSSEGSDSVLNVDFLLQLVLSEWQLEQGRRERHLLDVFRAGDVNGDGQLTSAEFTQIVLAIDATRDLGDILLMYSATLRRTECDQVNADVFLQVARDYELDRVVWQGDGDLFNIVNEVADMEATWLNVRGFFIGTLEALARDLPWTHYLRTCQGAGCGCLKCLVDGYIGFQNMRWELARGPLQVDVAERVQSNVGVSCHLVWIRFWQLMRQLYDAAVESEGIVTPWRGIQYVRDQAVPGLTPRLIKSRRQALPIYLFPDTARITAKMSPSHDPEAFDASTIHVQFADLLRHLSTKFTHPTT